MDNKIRIGKDFSVRWHIYKRDGDIREAYDLTGKELLFEYATRYGKKQIDEYRILGNMVEWSFLGKDQVSLGSYMLILTENKGKEGMVTVDACEAFTLVRYSCEENIDGSDDIVIQTIELESDVILAPSVVYVGDGDIKVDAALSTTSTNAIQNQAVTKALNKKQDTIDDLDDIRAGAEKGSTALQREQYTGTYSKPSEGIPKSDLASAVQESLNKADTALQAETYKGTVTGVKMNGQTKGTSGIVDLGTVITQHQDLSGKQDKTIVFDAVAIDYDVNVAETEITAEQIQTATGMTSEAFYDAVIAGRKVTLSLGEFYGSYELLATLDFSDAAYFIFGSVSVVFTVIIMRGGGGSIQQSAPLDDYYTKNEVDKKIASAITQTLNTAV